MNLVSSTNTDETFRQSVIIQAGSKSRLFLYKLDLSLIRVRAKFTKRWLNHYS